MNAGDNFTDHVRSCLYDACLVLVTPATGCLGYGAFVTSAVGFQGGLRL